MPERRPSALETHRPFALTICIFMMFSHLPHHASFMALQREIADSVKHV